VNGIPVFGLPGHPAAVTVCFDLFIKPVLRMLTGVHEKEYLKKKRTMSARIAKNVSSSPGREEHVRVVLELRGDEVWAVPVLGKSGLIRTLVMADGTVVIPAQIRGLQEGDTVEVLLF
jgi:molybdopterin molybdotransferase